MNIDVSVIVLSLGILIHFIAFIRIFTALESRLTALETTLEETHKTLSFISTSLIHIGLADRRGEKL